MKTMSTGASSPTAARATMPKLTRLLKPTDFKRVFRKNVVSADRFFRVMACPSQTGRARLGMAVSRKVDKRAVGRNRIKRVIRESFRQWRVSPESAALDVVVLVRPEAATICNETLFHSLNKHWLGIQRAAARRFPLETPA